MEWIDLNFNHKLLIDEALRRNPLGLSDYTFTNLWMWNIHRHYQMALIDNFICIRFQNHEISLFLYPIGTGSRKPLIEKLIDKKKFFRMRAVPQEALAELQELPLKIEEETEHFDYIYSYEDLLNLKGDHFQAKRNFIHQFENKYTFEYKDIDINLIPLLLETEKEWFKEHMQPSLSLSEEHESVLRALNDFNELKFLGGALVVNQKIVAYSLAEYLTKEMLVIHVEKALRDYKGAYATINQQLLIHLRPVAYINREEDLGLDNLIKVKQSYHPIRLEKKFILSSS